MPKHQQMGVLFDSRFLESYTGTRILRSPRTAIVELLANSWDAGATTVDIEWPDVDSNTAFSISDNGTGMTEAEFTKRWRTLAYNRQQELGPFATFPDGTHQRRKAFGRNGIGRYAGFCFGDKYYVTTKKDGTECTFIVYKGLTSPVEIEKIRSIPADGHGTRVYVEVSNNVNISAEEARTEIGMRFLVDPSFAVLLDGKPIDFSDIPDENLDTRDLEIDGVGTISVRAIDTQSSDRTTNQHGVAWRVIGRVVGECSWKGRYAHIIDGRTKEAKRLTFIVYADCLERFVNSDWSEFDHSTQEVNSAFGVVDEYIKEFLFEFSKSKRESTYKDIEQENKLALSRLAPIERAHWRDFVTNVQKNCPSIKESDIHKLGTLMANLEASRSRFALLHKLGELKPNQLDELHDLLNDWNIDAAKIVLDELKTRLLLLDELKKKIADDATDEVQELQPLFHRGLWIFGPEYESIEFTSNQGMTSVIQKIFGAKQAGSLNRPDFAILTDSSVGLYNYYNHDEDGAETTVACLTIVELKRPSISIGNDEMHQCEKYTQELQEKGYIDSTTKVRCFVIGRQIKRFQGDKRITGPNSNFIIQSLLFQTVIDRAKMRLLNLVDKVKNAPFLQGKDLTFITEDSLSSASATGQAQLPIA